MVEKFADFTIYLLDAMLFASFVYLAVRAVVWLRAWRQRRPKVARLDPFVVRIDRARLRESRDTDRAKGAAYCSECGFPLARKRAAACPFCAVVFEATR